MQSWRQAPGYGCRNGSGDGSPTHLNKRRMKKLGIITLLCILATDCEAQIMGGSHWDCSHWDRYLGMMTAMTQYLSPRLLKTSETPINTEIPDDFGNFTSSSSENFISYVSYPSHNYSLNYVAFPPQTVF